MKIQKGILLLLGIAQIAAAFLLGQQHRRSVSLSDLVVERIGWSFQEQLESNLTMTKDQKETSFRHFTRDLNGLAERHHYLIQNRKRIFLFLCATGAFTIATTLTIGETSVRTSRRRQPR